MKKFIILAMTAMLSVGFFTSCGGDKAKEGSVPKEEIDTISYLLGMSQAMPEQMKMYLNQVGSDSTHIDDFIKGIKDGMKEFDPEDKKAVAYCLGMQAGIQFKQQAFPATEAQIFAADPTQHINERLFINGLKDGAVKKTTKYEINGKKMDAVAAQEYLANKFKVLSEKANEAKYGDNKKKNAEYMQKIAKKGGIKSLGSGVYYEVVKESNGAKIQTDKYAKVKYKGELIDGKVFDQNMDAKEPAPMPVGKNQLVKGFELALKSMPIGSTWKVYIPSEMAYGSKGAGEVIPPFSTLIFTIELVGEADGPKAPQAPQPVDIQPVKTAK